MKESGAVPLAVDEARRDTSIQRAITRKISKNYAKEETENLWLLIFTSADLQTAYYEDRKRQQSSALRNAQQYLVSVTLNLFDEIWVSNLLTNPIQVWPINPIT